MGLHLAVRVGDARRTAYEPALTRHGAVRWCDSANALERAVATGSSLAMLEIADADGAPAADLLARLRLEHPTLPLIVVYDPVGEELVEAARLCRRRLGLWYSCEPDDEVDLLLTRCGAGRTLTGPTPAELAVECVDELSPPPAARRYAWFSGLTPCCTLDERTVAARCGGKLRTLQRQFAEIGLTAGRVRRAFQTLHAAYWLRASPREIGAIAGILGRPSARALREGIKDVLGMGVLELRHPGPGDVLSRHIVSRLRSTPASKPRRRNRVEADGHDPRRYRVAPHVSVTLTGDCVVANLGSDTHWALPGVTGAVLVEIMQSRSPNRIATRVQRDHVLELAQDRLPDQIVPRVQRVYGLTRGQSRAAVDRAVRELSAAGVIEADDSPGGILPGSNLQ